LGVFVGLNLWRMNLPWAGPAAVEPAETLPGGPTAGRGEAKVSFGCGFSALGASGLGVGAVALVGLPSVVGLAAVGLGSEDVAGRDLLTFGSSTFGSPTFPSSAFGAPLISASLDAGFSGTPGSRAARMSTARCDPAPPRGWSHVLQFRDHQHLFQTAQVSRWVQSDF